MYEWWMEKYNRHVQLIRMAVVESSAAIWSQYTCTRCQLAQRRQEYQLLYPTANTIARLMKRSERVI